MSRAVLLSAVLSAAVLALVEGGAVGSCPATAPDLNQCVREAIQQLVPLLAGGIPEIGAQPTDPLLGLPPFKYVRSTGLAPFTLQTQDTVLSGLVSVLVNDVQVDLSSNTIRVLSTIPGELVASGNHHTEGDVMGIPLRGSGPFKVTLNGAGLDLTLKGHPVQGPDGRAYLQLDSAKVGLIVGTPTADVHGFFSSYPPLEQAANEFANSLAGPLIAEMQPTLENWLAGIALEKAQSVFSTVSYDALFPGRTPAAFALFRTFPGYY